MERVGSKTDSPSRSYKTAKALRIARWQLTEIVRSSYPFVERSTLRKLINIAVITDCRTLYFYHVHPLLDPQDWVLVKHGAQVDIVERGW